MPEKGDNDKKKTLWLADISLDIWGQTEVWCSGSGEHRMEHKVYKIRQEGTVHIYRLYRPIKRKG